MELKKWDVILVNLDPTVGNEIQKTRPGIIVSPDEINKRWSPIVIVPLTSKIRELGFRPRVVFQETEGQAAIITHLTQKRVYFYFDLPLRGRPLPLPEGDLWPFVRKVS